MPKLEMKEGTSLGKHANGKWYYRASIPGLGEKIYSTGQTDFKDAKKAAQEIERELLKLEANYTPRTYREVAEEAFKVKQEENRASTRQEAKYIYDNRLIPAFGHLRIEEVNDQRWLDQIAKWKRDTDRKSFAQIRVYAKQIDRHAFNKGYKKFRCDFPVVDPKQREGSVISDADFKTLLDACENWYKDGKVVRARVGADLEQGRKLKLFLVMARAHGMRRGEVTGLPIEQIDLKRRSIILHAAQVKTGSKTGRGREFGIAPEAMPLLAVAIANAKTPFLFPNSKGTGPVYKKSLNVSVRRLARATGIEFKPHDLRHSFLTQKLLVEKKNPMDVAIYAGVSLQVIQSVYLHPKVDDTRHVVESGSAAATPPPAPELQVIQGGVA